MEYLIDDKSSFLKKVFLLDVVQGTTSKNLYRYSL